MKIYFISFIISIVAMIFSAIIVYNIADCIDPPVPEEKHSYMLTENIVKSFFLSIMSGAIVFITAVRLQRKK
ncbi:hypothetical protein F3J23_19630 [Chryseobacterium sp. Tr-659]|uniref:hypothetical protein n=1 Tax=Chryseobacterium sp. Tr-659 TaxID=2608340 RepID=UPI0014224369|nr:hypothetical protein [Chryseobacterium sp. Tr-659]NIF07639.1 hypothetical protein [Chryseobacterium sp. Tr-659]